MSTIVCSATAVKAAANAAAARLAARGWDVEPVEAVVYNANPQAKDWQFGIKAKGNTYQDIQDANAALASVGLAQ